MQTTAHLTFGVIKSRRVKWSEYKSRELYKMFWPEMPKVRDKIEYLGTDMRIIPMHLT